MLGASREVAPDRFAITELLLLHARSVQRSLTVSQARLSLAGLLEEPLALLLRLLEMLCDVDAGRPLPREGKAQFFGLLPSLSLAAGEVLKRPASASRSRNPRSCCSAIGWASRGSTV